MAKTAGISFVSILAGILLLGSCKSFSVDEQPLPADSSYFSIRQYIGDQINLLSGQPITLYRIAKLNGVTDSSLAPLMTSQWGPVINTFADADIATRKLLGQYDYNEFLDETSGITSHTYTAKNPGLTTRFFQINSDPSNNKITSIYIETAKKDFFETKTQKLLYVPYRIIQIQQREHYLIGKSKDLLIEYRFPQEQTLIED